MTCSVIHITNSLVVYDDKNTELIFAILPYCDEKLPKMKNRWTFGRPASRGIAVLRLSFSQMRNYLGSIVAAVGNLEESGNFIETSWYW